MNSLEYIGNREEYYEVGRTTVLEHSKSIKQIGEEAISGKVFRKILVDGRGGDYRDTK